MAPRDLGDSLLHEMDPHLTPPCDTGCGVTHTGVFALFFEVWQTAGCVARSLFQILCSCGVSGKSFKRQRQKCDCDLPNSGVPTVGGHNR
jgi:hypothetical protein